MSRVALQRLALAAGLVMLFAAPQFTRNEYLLALGVSFATFAVLSGCLNLVYGYTGLLSFAQVGFFGLGAYAAALLVTELDWNVWLAVGSGGLLAAAAGLAIGYSSLRLSRHAFAIVTLSFALLCMIISRDWVELTRGAMGIPGLPVPSLGLPGGASWRLAKPSDFYYLLLGYAVLVHAPIARGRITALDTAVAEAHPGVVLVLTHHNAPRLTPPPARMNPMDLSTMAAGPCTSRRPTEGCTWAGASGSSRAGSSA